MDQARKHWAASKLATFATTHMRTYSTFRIVAKFHSLMADELVMHLPIDDMTKLLSKEEVILASKQLFRRLYFLSNALTKVKSNRKEKVNTRYLLANWLMYYHPERVFESRGPLEQELISRNQIFLHVLGHFVLQIIAGKLPHQVDTLFTHNFNDAMKNYLTAFQAWKLPDQIKLANRIKYALLAMYETYNATARSNETVAYEIHVQVHRLRGRLVQICGQAALQEMDDEHPCPGNLRADLADVAPPSAVTATMDIMPERTTNEQMAHELLIDPDFQFIDGLCSLPFATTDALAARVKRCFHDAFWDSMADEMMNVEVPEYSRVVKVVREVCEALGELKVTGGAAKLMEAVEFEKLKQDALARSVSWVTCKNLLYALRGVVVQAQQDFSDHGWDDIENEVQLATTHRQHVSAFCSGMRYFMDRVNDVRVRFANSRMKLISLVVRDHGVEYELDKFNQKVKSGAIKLDGVNGWLKSQIEMVHEHSRTDVLNYPEQLRDFLRNSIVNLACGESPLDIPVTLHLDRYRLRFARENTNFLCTACAVSMYVKTLYGGADHAFASALNLRVLAHFQHLKELPSLDALAKACNENVTEPAELNFVARFIQDCPCLFESSHRLQRLVRSRLTNMWKDHVATDAPVDISNLRVLQQLGFRHLEVGRALRQCVDINLKVHGPLYRTLLAKVIRKLRSPALVRRPPVVKVDVQVTDSDTVMSLAFYPNDNPIARYTKANVGLLHAVPGSEQHALLLELRNHAALEGGFQD